jgi:hypothetical protein
MILTVGKEINSQPEDGTPRLILSCGILLAVNFALVVSIAQLLFVPEYKRS